MRNNLGRVLLAILIFLNLELLASTYRWSVDANKHEAMVNEAIHLKYVCEFSDEAGLYVIEFNPVVDNEKYTIELLSENEKIVEGKKINTFEFLAFVKKAGDISFVFDTTMKKTNEDSIQNTVLGRDNADYEEFSERIIRQKEILLNIKPSSSELVGSLKIDVKKDKTSIKAYEPYHLEIKIEGNANFKALKPIEFKIDGLKIFTQKVVEDLQLTKDGYVGSWSQKFAFVSDKDFKIPKLSIEYFDLKDKTVKELRMDAIDVEVIKAYKKEELLEAEEKSFEFSYDFLYYALTFIAGFLFAKIEFRRRKSNQRDANFDSKVNNAKSLDELMMILALEDAKKYEEIISKIEKKDIKSLNESKKMLEAIKYK